MPRVVCVCFRRAGRAFYFDAGDLELDRGDWVVCRTARGLEMGAVRSAPEETAQGEAGELQPVVRKATEEDLERDEKNAAREKEAVDIAAEKIAEHGLPMKLIEAEATLDGSRIVLHFSADGRVDFRALVRDLARALRARVELHQVGVRDEAKMRGGLGHCGRPLCCTTFLTAFDPVGIKMAKAQDLSLNPQKISGVCGRLMCCLSFEYEHYRRSREGLPKAGSHIETDYGPGKIKEINVLRDRAVVALNDGGLIEIPTAELAAQGRASPEQSGDRTKYADPGPKGTRRRGKGRRQ